MLTEQKGSVESESSIFSRHPELKRIPKDRFPNNVFIIPDGNGRWAKAHNLAIQAGHKAGTEVFVNAFNDLSELSDRIKFVGAWGLSMDNLKRPKEEVDSLMGLFNRTIRSLEPDLQRNDQRFIHIGRKDIFGDYEELFKTIIHTEYETRNNEGQVIYVAIGFNGADQQMRMLQRFADRHYSGEVDIKYVNALRDGDGVIPSADLIIRSSGVQRLSDVGWLQGNNTELYFDKQLFPAFTTKNFVKAIVDFSKRERNFGGRPEN